MSILQKVKTWLGNNPDKANSAIDKVGDLVDKRTQGKYASQVDKVQDAARKNFGGPQSGAPQSGAPQPGSGAGQPPANPPAAPTAPPTS